MKPFFYRFDALNRWPSFLRYPTRLTKASFDPRVAVKVISLTVVGAGQSPIGRPTLATPRPFRQLTFLKGFQVLFQRGRGVQGGRPYWP